MTWREKLRQKIKDAHAIREPRVKSISEHMLDVLNDNGCDAVMWGDLSLLDDCAVRCKHTVLMAHHPLDRHGRILNALERSPLFVKGIISGHRNMRCFYIKGREPKSWRSED